MKTRPKPKPSQKVQNKRTAREVKRSFNVMRELPLPPPKPKKK